jgi:hypothetical protein
MIIPSRKDMLSTDVELLRQIARNDGEEGEFHPAEHTCWMAADTIETLRARVADLENQYDLVTTELRGKITGCKVERDIYLARINADADKLAGFDEFCKEGETPIERMRRERKDTIALLGQLAACEKERDESQHHIVYSTQEWGDLKEQLAASQAENAKLRTVLEKRLRKENRWTDEEIEALAGESKQ